MDRRRFLSLLGLGAAAAVAPTKAYSFLGGILRKKPMPLIPVATPIEFDWVPGEVSYIAASDWRYFIRVANIDVSELVADEKHHLQLIERMINPPLIT